MTKSEAIEESIVKKVKKGQLVTECLMVIDHKNAGDKKIFITCDASDWHSGAILSFGKSWETVRLVVFDSMQFKGVELNYPIHKKELLVQSCMH